MTEGQIYAKSAPMKNMTDIIWYETIDSTNDQAKRILPELGPATVLAAVRQTAGRGQRGNVWKSEPGSNLTFSLVLKFGTGLMTEIAANCQFVISEALALGITDFLGTENISARIKWPNDIYVDDRKICGILIENSICAGHMASSIAGAGLNLNQKEFPGDIPNPVSLSILTGKEYDCRKVLGQVMECISGRMEQVYKCPESLRGAYLSLMYRKDEKHRYTDCATGQEFCGIIRGISDSALLQVEMPDGRIKEYAFKEIGYIIA